MDIVEENVNKSHISDDFTILFDKVTRHKTQVHEILPDWIRKATKVDDSFENSKKLSKVLEISDGVRNVLKKSVKKLFPVQHAVIPAIIKTNRTNNIFRPHDICVCAPTGSGKTLAYVIPILQFLLQDNDVVNGPRALVVLPVRDLALQVFNVFNGLAKTLGIRCALITGQKNLSEERRDMLNEEDGQCECKVDVIVCTPGRLVDHIRNTKAIDWSYLHYLVIDEADRILAEHKHDWYVTLSRAIDVCRGVQDIKRYKNIASWFIDGTGYFLQKVLLSATLTRDQHLLEHFDLHLPLLYVVGPSNAVARAHSDITEDAAATDISTNYAAPRGLNDNFVVYDKEYARILFIVDQVRAKKRTGILCFTNTRDSATRLSLLLAQFPGVRTEYLSCQLHPKKRRQLVQSFCQGAVDVMVTVDSMGRGMDFGGAVRCVIQYDCARDVHTHIHRVGRTARAGQEGLAFTLCRAKQVYFIRKELKECGRQIKEHKFQSPKCYKYLTEYNAALARMQSNVSEVAVIEGGMCVDGEAEV